MRDDVGADNAATHVKVRFAETHLSWMFGTRVRTCVVHWGSWKAKHSRLEMIYLCLSSATHYIKKKSGNLCVVLSTIPYISNALDIKRY